MRGFIYIFCWFLPVVLQAKTSAIIEEWTTNIDVKKSGGLTIVERIKVKILDEDGYQFGVFRTYYNSFRSVNNIRYVIYDESGNRVKRLGKDDAVDIMWNASYEVADVRLLYLEPNYRNFPFVVEIESETHYNGFIDFPLWMPRYSYDLEVKKAALIFTCPSDYKFRSVSYNGIKDPVQTTVTDQKRVTWIVENLPAVPFHSSYQTFADDQPKVHLAPYRFELDKKPGSFEAWKNFGDWYLELNPDENRLSDQTKKELDLIRTASISQKELIEQVYRYMQGKTRYVSIQLGIGGYKALPLEEVDKNGYGDCKALSSYTKAMLNYLKVPSNYVLVHAGEDVPDVIGNFPSNQFNHVFLAVPMKSDTVWLECTSQIVPPSYLGTFTDDRNALWVDAGNSTIIHTPSFSFKQSVKTSDCLATLDSRGNVALVIRQKQSGVYFDEIMAYKSISKDRIDNYNQKKFPYRDFTIQSFAYTENGVNQTMSLNFQLKINGLAKSTNNKLILPVTILSPVESEIDFDMMNKKSTIKRGFTWEDNVLVEIPESFYVYYIPEADKVETEFGKIEITVSAEKDQKIKINRKAVIYKGSYKGETFDRFNEFLKKVRSLESAKLVIQNKT
jgi:hypothetical protein